VIAEVELGEEKVESLVVYVAELSGKQTETESSAVLEVLLEEQHPTETE